MAYKIVNQMNPSMYKYNAPYAMNPVEICIHNTANTATARNEVSYMNRTANYTSFHVAIDDKEAVQAIPFNRNAFAAGDGANGRGNRRAIHIEICYSLDGGNNGHQSARYLKAEENAALYTAHVLHQYGWGVDKVKKHQDYSGKYCPHVILANGKWNWFKNRVQAHLNAIKKGSKAASKPVKANKPKPAPKKTVAKVPSKKARTRANWGWHWSGTFTATADIAIYRGDQHMNPKYQVKDGLKKGQFLNFDHVFMNSKGYWVLRVKYAKPGSSSAYFFMPIGKRDGKNTLMQANSKGKLWGKITKLNNNEKTSGVTNWHKKGAVK